MSILYFEPWSGTDEDRSPSYYSGDVSLAITGTILNGNAAVREQFGRSFLADFPGNRFIAENMIFATISLRLIGLPTSHKGLFRWSCRSRLRRQNTSCRVFAFDPVTRTITAGSKCFEAPTLFKQISSHQPQVPHHLTRRGSLYGPWRCFDDLVWPEYR